MIWEMTSLNLYLGLYFKKLLREELRLSSIKKIIYSLKHVDRIKETTLFLVILVLFV
jgi:hypothetical protein